jgi:hypothetical protein
LQLEIAGTLLPPLYTGGLLACELQISSPVRLSMASVLHRKFRKQCQLCLWRFNILQYLTLTSPGSGPSSRVTDQFSALTQSAGQHHTRIRNGRQRSLLQSMSLS